MGRPVEAKRKEYEKKLRWLDPEKYYEGVKGLDAYGWRDQLAFRRDLMDSARKCRRFRGELFREFGEQAASDVALIEEGSRALFKIVQKTPLVDVSKIANAWGPGAIPTVHYLRTVSSYQQVAVRPATVEDFYLAEGVANPVRVHEARRFFHSLGDAFSAIDQGRDYATHRKEFFHAYFDRWWNARFPDDASTPDDGSEPTVPYEPWMAEPLHEHGYLAGRFFLSIDVSAPDTRLIEEFKCALVEARGHTNKIEMPQLNISSWGECGLLPYIDLQIWAVLNDEPEIDPAFIRDRILPFGRREDDEARPRNYVVRNVTEPTYRKLMDSSRQEFTALVMKVAEDMLLWGAGAEQH